MIYKNKALIIFVGLFVLIFLFGNFKNTSAQNGNVNLEEVEYTLLAPLPLGEGFTESLTTNPATYIPSMVRLIIGLAGALAVIMIIIGGFKYISSDGFGKTSDAKEKIQNALLGLLLIIGSYSILYTLNPRLVNLSLSLEKQDVGEAFETDLGAVPRDEDGKPVPPPPAPGETDTTPAPEGGWGPCANCTNIVALPIKATACEPKPCMLNERLYSKLVSLNMLQGGSSKWIISEAWPPYYKGHVSRCHNPGPTAGNCLDAAIRGGATPPTPAQVKEFLDNIKRAVGSNFQYEVPSDARKNELVRGGVPASKIKVGGTGEHAHINYP